ncbi:hypothetical protein QCE63_01440 [Caballeronia sp. LZ065]|nr:hypothetical protein [Caballeronia sp. LZ065]MDR5778089.1 hypothetical protein [Caballeronia sp. LZ065]
MHAYQVRPVRPRLRLGRLFATPGAIDALRATSVSAGDLLSRHLRGDWGVLSEEDRKQNELALELGLRVLSCYVLSPNVKVWIITEWDRSVTTVLLPCDY